MTESKTWSNGGWTARLDNDGDLELKKENSPITKYVFKTTFPAVLEALLNLYSHPNPNPNPSNSTIFPESTAVEATIEAAAPQWEYQMGEPWPEAMNLLGEEGWELVNVSGDRAWFKRPLAPTKAEPSEEAETTSPTPTSTQEAESAPDSSNPTQEDETTPPTNSTQEAESAVGSIPYLAFEERLRNRVLVRSSHVLPYWERLKYLEAAIIAYDEAYARYEQIYGPRLGPYNPLTKASRELRDLARVLPPTLTPPTTPDSKSGVRGPSHTTDR